MKTLTKTHLIYSSLFSLFFVAACDTKEGETVTIPQQAKICFTVKHHALIIPTAEVFIKMNGGEYLGYDGKNYDRKVVTDTLAKACFTELPIGEHWLMAYGYDPADRLDVLGRKKIIIQKIDEQQDFVLEVSER
jgi:hypothetical protein